MPPPQPDDSPFDPDRTEVGIREVRLALEEGRDVVLLDVREPLELAIAAIRGARHIPMAEIPGRSGELPADRDILAFCHVGERSLIVTDYLRRQGFRRVWSLAGGIDAWAREIDPKLRRY
jgi:rhodanese-related sulfurtransferase